MSGPHCKVLQASSSRPPICPNPLGKNSSLPPQFCTPLKYCHSQIRRRCIASAVHSTQPDVSLVDLSTPRPPPNLRPITYRSSSIASPYHAFSHDIQPTLVKQIGAVKGALLISPHDAGRASSFGPSFTHLSLTVIAGAEHKS